jgi:hypothetical protein
MVFLGCQGGEVNRNGLTGNCTEHALLLGGQLGGLPGVQLGRDVLAVRDV